MNSGLRPADLLRHGRSDRITRASVLISHFSSSREPYFFFCFAKRKSKQKEKATSGPNAPLAPKTALRCRRTASFSWMALVFLPLSYYY
jgi:hypothetical protein